MPGSTTSIVKSRSAPSGQRPKRLLERRSGASGRIPKLSHHGSIGDPRGVNQQAPEQSNRWDLAPGVTALATVTIVAISRHRGRPRSAMITVRA